MKPGHRRAANRAVSILFLLAVQASGCNPATDLAGPSAVAALSNSEQYTKTTRSPNKTAGFAACEDRACLPLFYIWNGLLSVKYDRSGNTTTLRYVDQSVVMKNAKYSPCGVFLAVKTDVYDGSKFLRTVKVDRNGAYIVGSGSLIWGGTTKVSLSGRNLKLVTKATTAAHDCIGGGQFSWTTYLP